MADAQKLIDQLNVVLSWELAGTIQYLNASAMVTGLHRLEYFEFFKDGSKEARGHAEDVASRIVALGGIPTVEPAPVRVETTLDKMLEGLLELERNALAGWTQALEYADGLALGYGFWIEEMIAEEQEHVDELRKITGAVSFGAAAGSASSTGTAE